MNFIFSAVSKIGKRQKQKAKHLPKLNFLRCQLFSHFFGRQKIYLISFFLSSIFEILVNDQIKIPGQLRDPNQRQTSSDRYLEEQKSEKSNQI
jgi:hypothetical protein